MKTQTFSNSLIKVFACVACALLCIFGATIASEAQNNAQAFADGTTKTASVTQKITATFASDGTITVPNTEVQNGLAYTVTINDITVSSEYDFVKDWTCDGIGKTIEAGKTLEIKWSAPSTVPTSFDGTTEVKVGTITYTYSYVIPEITGSVVIEGTPEVGQTLTAQVSGLPSELNADRLAYAWHVVANDGSLTPIEGATAKTFDVPNGYQGKKVTCVVTDSTGHYKGSLQAEPVTIKTALLGSVSITQEGVVVTQVESGTELVATLSDVQTDANVTYAWYASEDGTNFTAIDGATAETFTPDATYVDKYVIVKVTSDKYTGVLTSTNRVKINEAQIAFVALAGDDVNGYGMYFAKRPQNQVPVEGGEFEIDNTTTITVAKVYSKLDDAALPDGSVSRDFEKTVYGWVNRALSTPWAEKSAYIKTATVVDDNIKPASTAYWYGGCASLTSVTGLSKLDTSHTTNVEGMFYNCSSLTNVSFEGFNTSSVVHMEAMFQNCGKLPNASFKGVENFDMSKVESVKGMFYCCAEQVELRLDLSKWNTSNITDMSYMFAGANKLKSVNVLNWDTSKVTDFTSMFQDCHEITSIDLKSFSFKNATSCYDYVLTNYCHGGLGAMFMNCKKLKKVTFGENCDTSNVLNFSQMFYNCPALETISGIETWDTSSAMYMISMFYSAQLLVENCSAWNVSNVVDHRGFNSGASGVVAPTWS